MDCYIPIIAVDLSAIENNTIKTINLTHVYTKYEGNYVVSLYTILSFTKKKLLVLVDDCVKNDHISCV